MKKIIFCASMMLASITVSAQFTVHENDKITFGTTLQWGKMNIGKAGDNDKSLYILSGKQCIYAARSGTAYPSGVYLTSIEGTCNPNSYYYHIGLRGHSWASTAIDKGRSYGVMGQAGNTTTGYNYGLFGFLGGSQNGTGVYGTSQEDLGISIDGRYAGYFNGDVKVTGTLYAPVLTTTAASSNAATAQVALAEANGTTMQTVSDKLAQLSAYSYNIQLSMPLASKSTVTRASITDSLSTTFNPDTMEVAFPSDIELQALEKSHYGLMAAQLQQIYPDLVYENQNGDLCINYIEMIPLLVESIKELKAEITTLQAGNSGGAVVKSRAIGGYEESELENEDALSIPMLKQNNPNPFTENTVIEYSLPETVQTANIYIYDMNGAQIMQIPVTERGLSSVTVNGGHLNAGMYLYSLIADGKVIDTKRMILTN